MLFNRALGQMIVMDLDDPCAPIPEGYGCRNIGTGCGNRRRRCGPPDSIEVTFPDPYGPRPELQRFPYQPGAELQRFPGGGARTTFHSDEPTPPPASPTPTPTATVSLLRPWGTTTNAPRNTSSPAPAQTVLRGNRR